MSEPQLPAVAGIPQTVIAEITDIQQNYAISNLVDFGEVEKGMMIAQGIANLTRVLKKNEEVVTCLMFLQGSKLGFRTDKKATDNPYPAEVVVRVYVEAILRGLQPTGNQFNIIAGNFYQTKEGFEHIVDNLPHLTDFYIEWDDYDTVKGTAKVKFTVTWKYKEIEDKMVGWVPVRVNSGMIVDAIYGKAERKVMARVLKKITKSSVFDEKDVSEINTTPVTGRTTPKLGAGSGKIGGIPDAPPTFEGNQQ